MRILRLVPGSTLFICSDDADAKHNLLDATRRSAVASDRIVFGKRIKREEYQARFRAMDLFLDTWPYNGGTTASDALWSGLPVLTCKGRSFASRYAASLLQAVDLPELITENSQQYEDLAVELATDPERLGGIRRKLTDHRHIAPLFDTRSFTGHLESAYIEILERYRAGLPPEHVHV
jgi:predicted O-linked N-acetylglucosamine transferase (SPINDLY family)